MFIYCARCARRRGSPWGRGVDPGIPYQV